MKRFQILPGSHLLSWQAYRLRWKFQYAQKELWKGRPAGGNLSSVIPTDIFCGLGSLGAPNYWWLWGPYQLLFCVSSFLCSSIAICSWLPSDSAGWDGALAQLWQVCSHVLGCCLLAASRKKRLMNGSLLLAPLWGSLLTFQQHYCVHQNAK